MGGVQFSTLYVAQSLDRSRWNPIVVCREAGDLTQACERAGVETNRVRYPRLWSTSVRIGRHARIPNLFAWVWNGVAVMRATRAVRKAVEQASADVVVTKGLGSHFIGGLAARRAGVPCVWQVQDLISERTIGIYRRIFAGAARWLPARIIVDGAAIKHQLPESIHARVSVVHNGIDTNVFHPNRAGAAVRRELGILPEQIVIGNVGRVTPWKGQHYLVEAFARIVNRHPQARLMLVGSPVFDHDGYERRLKSMVTELGLEDRVCFTGFRHDLPEVLAAMDVFVFTSVEKDTSPLTLLSAMASGIPIVAFDIEGVRELDETREAFVRTPVGDVEALADSLSKVLSDHDLRLRLQQSARCLAEEQFSLGRYVARIEEVFGNACPASDVDAASDAVSKISRATQSTDSASARAISAIGS